MDTHKRYRMNEPLPEALLPFVLHLHHGFPYQPTSPTAVRAENLSATPGNCQGPRYWHCHHRLMPGAQIPEFSPRASTPPINAPNSRRRLVVGCPQVPGGPARHAHPALPFPIPGAVPGGDGLAPPPPRLALPRMALGPASLCAVIARQWMNLTGVQNPFTRLFFVLFSPWKPVSHYPIEIY